MKRFPSYGLQLSSLQLLSNAALALVWCAADALLLSPPGAFELSALQQPAVVGGILYTGLISTALTVLLQARRRPRRARRTTHPRASTSCSPTCLPPLRSGARSAPGVPSPPSPTPRARTQTRALSMLPATDSSVIVATEPLWAAGFASLLLGEVLEPSAQLGGLLILAGCLANTVLPSDFGSAEAAAED